MVFIMWGLVGAMFHGNISNSYSFANASGYCSVGGLVGYISKSSVINSYSTGRAIATWQLGGLIGASGGVVRNSFWDTETSGVSSPGRPGGGTGKTTSEMKTKPTFTDAGWDFENVWNMDPDFNDGYPFLRCQRRIIPATVDIDPDTLNLKSGGKWITAYIELPEGYDSESIDISSVKLNGVSAVNDSKYGFVKDPEIKDRGGGNVPELMVKFDRSMIQEELEPSDGIELTLTGSWHAVKLKDVDTVRVIDCGKNRGNGKN